MRKNILKITGKVGKSGETVLAKVKYNGDLHNILCAAALGIADIIEAMSGNYENFTKKEMRDRFIEILDSYLFTDVE